MSDAVTSDFVPYVPGTRSDSRRNQAALALLKTGATEVVVLEEPIDSYKRNGRSYASKNASAKLANFKKNAVKAGFNVHAFTRPSSVTGDPVAIEGVVQVLGVSLPSDVKEQREIVKEAAKVEAAASVRGFSEKADGRRGKRRYAKPGLAKESADRAVERFLEKGWSSSTIGSWPFDRTTMTEDEVLRRANSRAQQVRNALKRAGVTDRSVRVRKSANGVRVYFALKK